MTIEHPTTRADQAGFTLIETLVALALTGLVLSTLANITSQWLPNWNRGVERIQRNESVSLALQRLSADIAAAESIPANREQRQPLFDGSELSVTFVRTAFGPNARPGLDVVRIGETTERQELVTVRTRAPFGPLAPGASLSEQIQTGDPVVLLRAPYRLSFAYAGRDRIWKSNWHDADRLPAAIQLTVRDAATEQVLSVSTVASIHVDAQVVGQCAQPGKACPGNSDGAARNSRESSGGVSKDNSTAAKATAGQGG
jgi:general secretion pathway protein J